MSKKLGFPSTSSAIQIPKFTRPNETNQIDVETCKKNLIKVANDLWGEYEWSYHVTNQIIDFVDSENGVFHIGAAAFVKITLKSGVAHEDLGYFIATDSCKGIAISQARKGAIVNGLQEVLFSFGGLTASGILENELEKNNCIVNEKPTEKCLNINNKGQINKRKLSIDNIITMDDSLTTIDDLTLRENKILQDLNNQKSETKVGSFYTSTPVINSEKNMKTNHDQNIQPTVTSSKCVLEKNTEIKSENVLETRSKNSNTAQKSVTEEELRAERIRRQKQLQEQFRLQLQGKEQVLPQFCKRN